jgi:hypothetical protein
VSVVWKEDTVVSVRDRVRVERTALGIARGQNKVVEAVQDEASPTTLPGEPPKAKNLLLKILAPGGRGCAKNPAKRFLLVAVVGLKKRVSSEALGDGGSVENQARAFFLFVKL